MKNLKTVGKVVALIALVATQANALEVPGWSWTQENIVNPAAKKGLNAINFVKNIQWKDGVVTQFRIASTEPRQVTIRVNGQDEAIESSPL